MNSVQSKIDRLMNLNPTIPEEARKQLESEEMEQAIVNTRKQLWARVFSVSTSKENAYKMMDRLISKVKGWSFYNMSLDQLEQCYSLTNDMENRL